MFRSINDSEELSINGSKKLKLKLDCAVTVGRDEMLKYEEKGTEFSFLCRKCEFICLLGSSRYPGNNKVISFSRSEVRKHVGNAHLLV